MKIVASILCFFALFLFAESRLYADSPMLAKEVQQRKKQEKKKVVKNKDRKGDGTTISTMTYDQLEARKNELVKQKDFFNAIKYLEEMIKICEDHREKQELMLELGEYWVQRQEYKFALRLYKNFKDLYPGSEHIGFVLRREIECSFAQLLTYDRDQTNTQDTLKLCEEFMEYKNIFAEHVQAVVDIEKQCRQRLFEHEMYVAEFYLFRGNFKAAQKRIDTIGKQFNGTSFVVEPPALEFKIRLAQANDDMLSATKYKIELAQKYPQHTKALPFVASLPDLKLELAMLEAPQTQAKA